MGTSISLEVAAECGLVLQQAGRSVVRSLRVRNSGPEVLVGLTLTVRSDLGLFHPFVRVLDVIQSGEEIAVPVPAGEPRLDYAFLSKQTDVCRGTVCAVLTDADGAELARAEQPHTVYAPDQTLGCERPIYYAAFVVPQCGAVVQLKNAVSEALAAETGDGALTGYQRGKQSVYGVCRAAYRAVQGLGLTYAVSPATFGQPGQKVRLPDDLVRGRTGCCLDTTLLFAALFEQCGLRPVLVILRGHAFVGCHLTDASFPEPVVSDLEVLRKAIRDDTFAVIETTAVGGDGDYTSAELSARQAVLDKSCPFACAVDVARARAMGVHPLPVASDGTFSAAAGRAVEAAADEARTLAEDVNLDAVQESSLPKGRAAARIDGWAQRLLELSKANRLLNVRDHARVVPLLCARLPELVRQLADGRVLRVRTYENFLDAEAVQAYRRLASEARLAQYGDLAAKALEEGDLWGELTRRESDRRLKELFRAARTEQEDSGANTLFLAVGILEWCEAGHAAQRYRAPILLVPVRLERRSLADGYRLRRTDDDPLVNTTLLEMLRREYRLEIPGLDPLPADEAGCDVERVLGIFRAAVRDLKGLCVVDEALVGQFSFGKFVMWKDLTARMDAVRANPIVAHLLERNGTYDDGVEVFPPEEVGRHLDYAHVCCPLSADASQLTAVLYSGLGKSFVLHGPPGTGKSQTITNLIAHNLWLGRRVLFVAEKKAALDVVYGRLSRLGLAPYCLRLHSSKTSRAEVYAQLSDALSAGSAESAAEAAATAREADATREQLDAYVRALHRQTVSGFTPYALFTRLVRGELNLYGENRFAGPTREVTRAQYEEACQRLAEAATARGEVSAEAVSALAGVAPFAWSPAAERKLSEEASALADEIESALADLQAQGGPGKDAGAFLGRYFRTLGELRKLERNLARDYRPDGLRALNVRALRTRLAAAELAFLPVRVLQERALAKECAGASASGKVERGDLHEVLRLAGTLQEADAGLGKMEGRVRELLGAGFVPAQEDPEARLLARAKAENRLEAALRALGERLSVRADESPADAVARARSVAQCARGNVQRAFRYFEARRLVPSFARAFVAELDRTDRPDPQAWTKRFADAFQAQLLNEVLESEPAFGTFLGTSREASIARFRELDAACSAQAQKRLVAKLAAQIPRQDGRCRAGAEARELGLVMHECGKKTKQMPLRQLMAETPMLMPALKPCFLMSPLTVAQYLPVDAGAFDLVVFDEASQIPVWDAIGVIARGRQLVVVGDPKQLPPTSFFQSGLDEEDAGEDLESVLEECLHAGLLSCHLDWHYRSRHESLIAFSNQRYYDGRLHFFPAAELSARLGVSFVHVPDGVYGSGGNRSNRREAETVADIIFGRLADPACAGTSIGVVTFSEAQRNLVEDVIDERRAQHPATEAFFAADSEEPFFVKNLENVQGDERDTIIFSIGYAPDEHGRFSMLFGPLGSRGGERRLNVAVTRAKEKIIVVSSIHGYQIDTDRISTQGPADLRAFLDYAEHGYRIALPGGANGADAFAAEVASVLERAGAQVARDVGCGGVRVDVAVRDPDNGGRFVLGVLCDGPGYANERTTHDRDRLRDEALGSLGWRLCHAWVVDWALDRARAEQRLLAAYEEALARGKEENK